MTSHADHITPWHPDCAICRAVTDPGIAEPDPIAPARGCLIEWLDGRERRDARRRNPRAWR